MPRRRRPGADQSPGRYLRCGNAKAPSTCPRQGDALQVRAASAGTTGSPLQRSTPPISPAAMTASSALRTVWEHSEQSSDFAFSSASPNATQALNPAG